MYLFYRVNSLLKMRNIFKSVKNTRQFSFVSSRSCESEFDVCIVGGGPVGFGLASLLGEMGRFGVGGARRVALLEAQKPRPYEPRESHSSRTVALSLASRDILSRTSAWEIIERHGRHCAVEDMFVWEQLSDSFIRFQQEESEKVSKDLAYIVETDLLLHAITSTVNENIVVKYGTAVTSMNMTNNGVSLCLTDGSEIKASLVVGADGYRSKVREWAKITSTTRHYDQKAIVAVVRWQPGTSSPRTAWQRFTKTGPIAYLPLDSEHSNLIWSTTNAKADQLMTASDEEFIKQLNHEIFTDEHRTVTLDKVNKFLDSILAQFPRHYIDECFDRNQHKQLPPVVKEIVPGSKASFPLGYQHANNYVAPHVALVGDAAHRILPLAGQGVNLGLGDVECLARCLEEGSKLGEATYNHHRLQKYETERQRFVLPVAATVQSLHELYLSSFTPIVLARAVGLKVVNAVKPFKGFFLDSATKGKLTLFGYCTK